MCYRCNRPEAFCLCKSVTPVATNTKFVLLIHPKEYKRIKNNTGRLTHLSLTNSVLFSGVDFSRHTGLNKILSDPGNFCVILYPSDDSLCLNDTVLPLHDKQLVIILIDATWASARPMLRLSRNLHTLPKITFSHAKTSAYSFKRQPFAAALSTIESTHAVLEILQKQKIENIPEKKLQHFLDPFYEMVKLQLKFNP